MSETRFTASPRDFCCLILSGTPVVAALLKWFRVIRQLRLVFTLMIIGAAQLSNWLHRLLSGSVPSIDVATAHQQNFSENDLPGSRGGIGPLLNTAIRIIGILLETIRSGDVYPGRGD